MSEHVRAGGSRIHRIMACPASLKAPDSEAGPAAAKGTTAHYVGERCIATGCNADHASFTGPNVTVLGQVVDRAMSDAVQVYVDWARGLIEQCKAAKQEYHLFLEHQVTWDALGPPEPMRGSADFILVIPSMALMVVGDYKNGVEWVEAVGNKQTRYYAVGALLTLPREITQHVRRVQMTIIQPNVPGISDDQAVRSETIDVGELLDFAEDAMSAVALGQKPDAPAVPGSHCKYCSLASTCAARANHSVAVAQDEFQVLVQDATGVAVMPIEDLSRTALLAEEFIARASAWLKDAKERLEAELKAGADVPDWKMVPKRAQRVWTSEADVKAWALDAGLSDDDIYATPVLKSPAQMEDVVGKKNLPADLYSSVSSGYNLVRASSSKPAARIAASDEFETVKP